MYFVYLGLHDKTSLVTSSTYSFPTVKMTPQSLYVVIFKLLLFTFIFTGRFPIFNKHESYDDKTLRNDIALFYLSTDVTLNNYIQIACLPTSTSTSTSYPGVNLDVYAVGWGKLSSSDTTTPNLLNNVKLSTYTASQCPYTTFYDAGIICAGNLENCFK